MKKSTRIVKRIFALLLVVLMSIESFAAVVSDNDGSAFITKAEFDSLKNNFQSQIDQYNTSIDSKIDGAIASYLSGINLAKNVALNYPNNILTYKDLSEYTLTESRMKVDMTNTIVITCQYGVNGGGACDCIGTFSLPGTTGKGYLCETFGSNFKNCLLDGFGSFNDTYICFGYDAQNNDQAYPDTLNNRTRHIQFYWSKGGYNWNSLPTSNTYYGDYINVATQTSGWFPYMFGNSLSADNYCLGLSNAPKFRQHKRTVEKDDTQYGVLANDTAYSVLVDKENINGLSIKMDNTFLGTLDYTWYYHPYVTANYVNSNSNNYYKMVNTYLWSRHGSGDKYGDAYLHIAAFNTSTSGATNTGIKNAFNGKNKLLYGSYIQNPVALCTDRYTDGNFQSWLSKLSNANAKLVYKGENLWNLRYGSLLLCENDSEGAKYEIKVKNNKSSAVKIKFYNNVQNTNFNNIIGIATEQSSGTDNAVTINGNETKTIKFETYDNLPIFFKCSNGANITFIDKIIKTEK